MYPAEELNALAGRKIALCRGIAEERGQCAAAVERILRPLAWLDRMRARWRGLSPFVKLAVVPLALVARRQLLSRVRRAWPFLRWLPLVARAVGRRR